MRYKTFVISLLSSYDRKESFNSENNWLEFEFFDAVDAKKSKIPFISSISRYFGSNDFSLGAFGCLLSHRRLWKKLLQSDYDSFIIFEDDVIISENYFNNWLDILSAKNDYDVVFMGANNGLSVPNFCKIKYISIGNGFLAQPFYQTLYCAYAYIITKPGAVKMLSKTKIGYPVDYWGLFNNLNELKLFVIYPNIARPSETALNSSIQANKEEITLVNMILYYNSIIITNIIYVCKYILYNIKRHIKL
jgi:glycosyl transferase family 25